MYGPYLIENSQGLVLNIFVTIAPLMMNGIIHDMTVESTFMTIFRKDVLCAKKISNEIYTLIHLFLMDTPSLKNAIWFSCIGRFSKRKSQS